MRMAAPAAGRLKPFSGGDISDSPRRFGFSRSNGPGGPIGENGYDNGFAIADAGFDTVGLEISVAAVVARAFRGPDASGDVKDVGGGDALAETDVVGWVVASEPGLVRLDWVDALPTMPPHDAPVACQHTVCTAVQRESSADGTALRRDKKIDGEIKDDHA